MARKKNKVRHKRYQLISDDFWKAAGGRGEFPCQMEVAVLWALPLAVIKLPRLWVLDVDAWLAKRNIEYQFRIENRALHGSLIAYRGYGFVLLNGADSDAELRYSLAHEAAHFLLNYLRPRRKAESILGPTILEVFDGFRPPTIQERIHSILDGIPIGFHIHLMERNTNSMLNLEAIMELEDNTDMLAIEMIAPENEVRCRVKRYLNNESSNKPVDIALQLLQGEFGLPQAVAEIYASRLYPAVRSSSVREWLRQKEE
ncbi:MAG: hypothetical protein WC359_10710 [Dehalococcoidia bacterium]|jgi:Zn-dependent peptidase ImmA (M78 family)